MRSTLRSQSCRELAQDIVQYSAVVEVFELVESIDAADQRHPLDLALRRRDLGGKRLARLQSALEAADGDGLVALDTELPPRHALPENQPQGPPPPAVGTVDAPH